MQKNIYAVNMEALSPTTVVTIKFVRKLYPQKYPKYYVLLNLPIS